MSGNGAPRRGLRTMLVVTGLALALALANQQRRPSAPGQYCAPGTTPADQLVMLSTSWCPYCARARDFLADTAVPWCEYDTETSTEGARLYREARARGVPVFLRGQHAVHGFSAPAVRELIERHRS